MQIDGSDYAWFEDHGSHCTLLVFVDDATSESLQLLFTPRESFFGYCQATPVSTLSGKASRWPSTAISHAFKPHSDASQSTSP